MENPYLPAEYRERLEAMEADRLSKANAGATIARNASIKEGDAARLERALDGREIL